MGISEKLLLWMIFVAILSVLVIILASINISGQHSKRLEGQIISLKDWQAIKNDPVTRIKTSRDPYPSGQNVKRRIIPIGEKFIDGDGNIRQT